MKRLRLILGVLITLIVIGIVVALVVSNKKFSESQKDEEGTLKTASTPPSIEAQKLKYTESEGGKTLYEIESGSAKFYKNESRTEFTDIRVTFYYQDQYEVLVSGDRGELNTDTKNITISGNVKITAASDYSMTTDSLSYNADTSEITTDAPILIAGPAARFEGKGLVFNLKTEELLIPSPVTTDITGGKTKDITPPGTAKTDETGFTTMSSLESPLHINANGFMGNRKENFFRYTGGATAVYKDARLTASTITVWISDAGKIKRIEAAGGVRIVQQDIKGSAGLLTLDYEKKLMTLLYNPVLWRGKDMVKGERILYYLDEKKSVALGGGGDRAHLTIYPQQDNF